MNHPVSRVMPCGKRLHLQHGPIDLIVGVDGDQLIAFEAATARFRTVLTELVEELVGLRKPISEIETGFNGEVARRMFTGVQPFKHHFVTPMAAVAGAVSDEILAAICERASPRRAYVNNGGDIALKLSDAEHFTVAISSPVGARLGEVRVAGQDNVGGLATSGRQGRSLSLGIADCVTVLAETSARADAAATLIANAVDLPGSSAIHRAPANTVQTDSDLGQKLVTVHCDRLDDRAVSGALTAGARVARNMIVKNQIIGAALFLQDQSIDVTRNNPFFHTKGRVDA